MASRKRPEWSRPLPRPLAIPGVMTLKTLADVRALIGHLPAATQQKETWRHVAAQLDAAARGSDPADAAVALQLVLMMENVPLGRSDRRKQRGRPATAPHVPIGEKRKRGSTA